MFFFYINSVLDGDRLTDMYEMVILHTPLSHTTHTTLSTGICFSDGLILQSPEVLEADWWD